MGPIGLYEMIEKVKVDNLSQYLIVNVYYSQLEAAVSNILCKWEIASARCKSSNIIPLVSKHCSAAHYTTQRCPLDKPLMLAAKSQTSLDFARLRATFRRWWGITFAMEYSANLITYNGNVKGKPAPSKSQQPAVQASEIGQNLFERCMCTLLSLREKRVVLSPMFERKAVCGTIAGEQCLRRREL